MEPPEEPFDIDALISLETGVQFEALEAFFRSIVDNSSDTEKQYDSLLYLSDAHFYLI